MPLKLTEIKKKADEIGAFYVYEFGEEDMPGKHVLRYNIDGLQYEYSEWDSKHIQFTANASMILRGLESEKQRTELEKFYPDTYPACCFDSVTCKPETCRNLECRFNRNIGLRKGEIEDYHKLGEFVSEVYCHVTGGSISKPFTIPRDVIGEAERRNSEAIESAIKEFAEELQPFLDDLNRYELGVQQEILDNMYKVIGKHVGEDYDAEPEEEDDGL